MKRYIAPQLEVELYALDASIAAGCAITQSYTNALDASCIVGGNDSVFAAGGNVSMGQADSSPKGGSLASGYYSTPNFGNPGVSQANGSCDCYYSAYGVMTLATS